MNDIHQERGALQTPRLLTRSTGAHAILVWLSKTGRKASGAFTLGHFAGILALPLLAW